MHVHHLAFRTPDVPRLTAFYVDVFGLVPTERPPGATGPNVWLRAGQTLVMIEERLPAEPEVPAGAMDLVAFAITPEERAPFLERLARAGVTLEGSTPFSVYLRDPDGRRVGVSHFATVGGGGGGG